jgi:ubiquinone/menaquinone biosynthesis C-methylase UbiE
MILARAWWRLVELGFRLLYNELAWTYDLVSWVVSLGDWRRWQRTALRFLDVPPGSPVLEIAHGTGNLQIDLRTADLIPTGLDLSPAMGRIARRKLRRHGLATRLVRGQGEALPFPAERFPAVVSTFPTPFITEEATLREIYRVLLPGGRLVIVANGLLTGGGLLGRALEWAYRVTGQRGPWLEEFAARFGAAGFRLYEERVRLERSETIVIVCQK